MTKKTVGELALELSKDRYPQDVIETQRVMQKTHLDDLILCAKRHENHVFKDGIIGREKPYYVCVQLKRERLRNLQNVIRTLLYARRSRPIPDYDLSLYYYDPKTELLSFVWAIPDKETVEYILLNHHLLPPDHEELYNFCKQFKECTLI